MDPNLPDPGLMRLLMAVTAAFFVIALGMTVYALAVRLRNVLRGRRREELEARWKPLLHQVLHGDAAPDDLRDRVGARDRPFFLEFLVRYARRFQGPEQRAVNDVAEPWLDRAVRQLDSDDVTRRATAAETIATLGMPERGEVILDVLDDPAPLVALTAARALLAEEHAAYVDEVLERLPRFRSWNMGYLAATLALAGAAGAPALRRVLGDPGADSWMRRVCAEALRRVPDYEARDVARRVLDEADDVELLAAALRLAAAIGAREEADAVRPFLRSSETVLRIQAAHALGAIGTSADIGRLRTLLEEESRWVALAAARAIQALGDEELLERRADLGDPVAEIVQRTISGEAA